jgi:hypothetical protein
MTGKGKLVVQLHAVTSRRTTAIEKPFPATTADAIPQETELFRGLLACRAVGTNGYFVVYRSDVSLNELMPDLAVDDGVDLELPVDGWTA